MSTFNSYDETDSESMGSWDDHTDNQTHVSWDDDELVYDPEEPSSTKYNIVLCELYNREYHGQADGEINNHYLSLMRFKNYDYNNINNIRVNYPRTFRLEIAECLYLPSYHCVSILKTHWLKLIQRTWKKIYRCMKQTILIRSHPNSLKYREINGRWPNNCSSYPTLRGMLSKLSRTSSGSSS